MFKQNFIYSVTNAMNEHNSEVFFILLSFTIAFAVATSRPDTIFLYDTSIKEYLAQRTQTLNSVRDNTLWPGIIKWIEGILAGSFTLLLKPSLDELGKKYLKPQLIKFGNKILKQLKKKT